LTNETPQPRQTPSMSTTAPLSPLRSLSPTAGFACPPVIAVMPLSRIASTSACLLYTALTSPGIPMWKKVESPIVATIGFASMPLAFCAMKKPDEIVTEAPMSMTASTPFWLIPSV
jgi:hypothetical protein